MNLWQAQTGESIEDRRQQAFDTLWRKLARNEGVHYAVVDTARDDAILSFVRTQGDKAVCLYRGDARIRLANYAPYLFQIDTGCAVTRQFLAKGWGQSWYILIGSPHPIADIAWQLRKALIVRTDEGQDFYFRFYDPRVLRAYLAMSSQDDADKLMGNAMVTLFCESHDATGVTHCRAKPASMLSVLGGKSRDYHFGKLQLIEEAVHG